MVKFERERLIFGLYLIVLVAVAQLASGYLKLPAWPAFIALILFFVEHMQRGKVWQILCGAVAGSVLVLLDGTAAKDPRFLWNRL